MINKELRELIAKSSQDAVLFDNPSFDKSIVGISSEGGVIYKYELMIEELKNEDDISYEEAAEFIDYNTLRSLPYTTSVGIPPIIMYDLI